MRTLILSVIMALLGFKAVATPVPLTINTAFKHAFPSAGKPSWSMQGQLYKASFQQGTEKHFAYFTSDGTLAAEARYVGIDQLPNHLQTGLFKKYPDQKIVALFEIISGSDVDYYITLESASGITTQLQAPDHGKWKPVQQPVK